MIGEHNQLIPKNLFNSAFSGTFDDHQARAQCLLSKRAFSLGLRRKAGDLFTPVLNDGHNFVFPCSKNAFAFKRMCSVTDFVYDCIYAPEGQDTSLVDFIINSRNVALAVKSLVNSADWWTIELEINIYIFAYRDGLFDTRTKNFYTFTKVDGFSTVDQMSGNVATNQCFDFYFLSLLMYK